MRMCRRDDRVVLVNNPNKQAAAHRRGSAHKTDTRRRGRILWCTACVKTNFEIDA